MLEGNLQKAGNRVGITAQLINVADESLLWSEQYRRELEDIFAIQDHITLAIVDKLKMNLSDPSFKALLRKMNLE